ncbi:MAG: ABC transporter ATP-binding protein [Spirochaetales bacterium]|nr:ABC transporter ATP-binding protein [Candidatus Physcosoma equi]
MAYLSIKNLNLTIESRRLLEDVSFDVEKGTLTLVAGRNGSGKSLLLKCLKGLEKPDSGVITLCGRELKKTKERMKTFGLVFQDTSLQIVGSTVEHDIAFGLENQKKSREEIKRKTDEMLSLFDLEYAREMNPGVLSGGEKRRLCIAGVLAMEPDVLLLDEPLANLDYPSVLIVLKTLQTLKEKGITVIIVSHEAEKFLSLTDNTIVISKGRIAGSGRSEDMMDTLRENAVYLPKACAFKDLSWLED